MTRYCKSQSREKGARVARSRTVTLARSRIRRLSSSNAFRLRPIDDVSSSFSLSTGRTIQIRTGSWQLVLYFYRKKYCTIFVRLDTHATCTCNETTRFCPSNANNAYNEIRKRCSWQNCIHVLARQKVQRNFEYATGMDYTLSSPRT